MTPPTQSVQATDRFEKAAGRQIDPGIVAIVRVRDVRLAAARQRVEQVAAGLRRQPEMARVLSYYGTRDPSMVSRSRRLTYVVAYFRPLSDRRLKDATQRVETEFAGQHDVQLGGQQIANVQANALVSHDLARAELLAFPFIFLLSLVFFRSPRRSVPARAAGRARDRRDVLRAADRLELRRPLGVRDQLRRPGSGSDWRSTTACSWCRATARRWPPAASAARRCGARSQTAGRTILFSSLTVAAAIASLLALPAALPLLDGHRRRGRRRCRRRRSHSSSCRPSSACSARASTRSRRGLAPARRRP